jgi:hypothetical protein
VKAKQTRRHAMTIVLENGVFVNKNFGFAG